MSQYKSKAEERRMAPYLEAARRKIIAARRDRVVEAAMAYWKAKPDLTFSCLDLRKMEDAEDAACAALDAAEKERP